MLETVEVETGERPAGSVVWLHGLGADGHDFEALVPELRLPDGLALRFVFPHAPVRPVTINNGVPMRAWYDVLGLDRSAVQDEKGIRESVAAVRELVSAELERGGTAQRIVLAGFSQGGAIALATALRYEAPLAGVMALSSYLPLEEQTADELSRANASLPVFMAHGRLDPMLPIALGLRAREWLERAGFPVVWHDYEMGHAVCPQEIADVSDWLAARFAHTENS